MAGPAIFSGNLIKILKPALDFFGAAQILSGTVNPSVTATSAPIGSLYLNSSSGVTYKKTDAGLSTNWLVVPTAELASATTGGVYFGNGTQAVQDATTFFWDNTNKRLGIGIASPTATLQVVPATAATIGQIIRGAASQTASFLEFQDSSSNVLANFDSTGKLLLGVFSGGAAAQLINFSGNRANFSLASSGSFRIETTITRAVEIGTTDAVNTAYFSTSSEGNAVAIGGSSSSVLGKLSVLNTNAATKAFVIRGFTSQTANLTEWQDSAGTVLSSIDSAGRMIAPIGTVTNPSISFIGSTSTGIYSGSANTLGLVANTVEVARFLSSGVVNVATKVGIGSGLTGGTGATNFSVTSTSAANVVSRLAGTVSQTGNLSEWVNNVGTILASVTSAGFFQAGGATGANTLKLQSDRAAVLIKGSTDAPTGPFIDYDINSTVTAGTTFIRLASGTISGATSGTNVIALVSPTYNPAAGSGVFRAFDINYTNNASGAQSGSSTGLRVNRNTSGTAFTTDVLADFQAAGASLFRIMASGNVGAGVATPTAVVHLKAGTATAGTAPLKLTSGVNLTTPEAGAVEYDGTNLYYTDSGATRRTVAVTNSTLPTIQKFTTGTALTYTTPAGARYIRVRMVGAGGGGGGSGTGVTGGTGGAGGNTTFGTSLLAANGGLGGANYSAGAGGSASLGTGPIGSAIVGSGGSNGGGLSPGPQGAPTPFGGGGSGGLPGITAGGPASGFGAGGGGAGGNTGVNAGASGAAGGFIDAIITSPSATYTYTIGAGGAGGAAGTSGVVGGAGAGGYIEVTEYYA